MGLAVVRHRALSGRYKNKGDHVGCRNVYNWTKGRSGRLQSGTREAERVIVETPFSHL